MNREALREMAEALPPGAAVPLPREWVLELLAAAPDPGQPDLFSVAQLAERYGQGASTVRTRLEQGEFPGAFKVGRAWRVPRTTVEATEGAKGTERVERAALAPRKPGRGLGAWRGVNADRQS